MKATPTTPLTDRFGRTHTSVRLSVTDRCNIRCFYCMPESGAEFMPRSRLLTFEEIERLARLLVSRCGVRDIRITGGEPLVRRQLERLVRMLSAIDGLEDLSLTTNGILLAEQAAALRAAGLRRINISLDTLDEKVFQRIARRPGLDRTIAGIDAAVRCGFDSVKLNSLAIRRDHRGARSSIWSGSPWPVASRSGSSNSCRWTPTAPGTTNASSAVTSFFGSCRSSSDRLSRSGVPIRLNPPRNFSSREVASASSARSPGRSAGPAIV